MLRRLCREETAVMYISIKFASCREMPQMSHALVKRLRRQLWMRKMEVQFAMSSVPSRQQAAVVVLECGDSCMARTTSSSVKEVEACWISSTDQIMARMRSLSLRQTKSSLRGSGRATAKQAETAVMRSSTWTRYLVASSQLTIIKTQTMGVTMSSGPQRP